LSIKSTPFCSIRSSHLNFRNQDLINFYIIYTKIAFFINSWYFIALYFLIVIIFFFKIISEHLEVLLQVFFYKILNRIYFTLYTPFRFIQKKSFKNNCCKFSCSHIIQVPTGGKITDLLLLPIHNYEFQDKFDALFQNNPILLYLYTWGVITAIRLMLLALANLLYFFVIFVLYWF